MTTTRPLASDSDCSVLEALNDRMLAFQASGASQHTISHYRLIVGRLFYFRYLKPRKVLLLRDITPHHITEWLAIRQKQVSHRTVDSNWRVLRGFLNWCVRHGYLERNPCDQVDAPKRLPVFKPDCREEDLQRVLQECPDTPTGLRDKALILFLLDTGLRIHEALKVRVCELGEAIPIVGKGGRTRVVFVTPATLEIVQQYVQAWKLKPQEALWQGKQGPLTTTGAKHIITLAGQRAGVKLGAHMLRRSCATWMAKSGASLEAIRQQLGHADIRTTQQYLAYQLEDVKREHQQYSPIWRLQRR